MFFAFAKRALRFRGETVAELSQNYPVCPITRASFAERLSVARASRFICSFMCEYLMNTFASPCRSSCVTHSSATPPALKRVAYVERTS